MTKQLSPAAQAVLKAACIHHGLFNEEIVQRRRMVAAALRAAALHLYSEEYETCGGYSYDLMIDQDDLLALAAELEGA